MKKTIHIISHSHLDREWYMPFEKHRYNVVRLIDDIMYQKENDENFKSFHLDGQMIPVFDYLEIKPWEKERFFKHIKDGTINVGPWYILQDCFLTSAEANVRNMQVGLYLAKKIGTDPVKIGYFPDTFGNISQAPQILKKFNINTAAFGRGLNEVGFDNKIIEQKGINQSELIWESPDGSSVNAIFFANWYCNACDIPFDSDDNIVEFFKVAISRMEKFSRIDDLLALNGCDHLPLRKDIGRIVKLLNERLPEYNFIHSNFKDYIKKVEESKDKFSDKIFKGEINAQYTTGYNLLINTASTRVDIKRMNYDTQNRLEKEAEPIATINYIFTKKYDEYELLYSWKKLLENHPHDSICSCSVDDVNSEVISRFKKAYQVATTVRDEAFCNFSYLVKNDTENDAILFFNKFPNKLSSNAHATMAFDPKLRIKEIEIIDKFGNIVPSRYEKRPFYYTYSIPKEGFRRSQFQDLFDIEFLVNDVPPLGYMMYYVKAVKEKKEIPFKKTSLNMENDYVMLTFNPDGSFNLLNKKSGNTLNDLNYFEYTCDIGEEYNYKQSLDKIKILSKGQKAKITKVISDSVKEVANVNLVMRLPKERNENNACDKLEKLELDYDVILFKNNKFPIIKLRINNTIKDYRLRAIFDTKIDTKNVYSEGQFDLVKRDIYPWAGWINPVRTDRFDNFVMLKDDKNGFLISSKGLHEYEVIRDNPNVPLALTLIRAVGEMGDFGFFPTPDAQLQKSISVEYMIEYFDISEEDDYIKEAYKFKSRKIFGWQVEKHNKGYLPSEDFFMDLDNKKIQMSAFKKAFFKKGVIARFYSISFNDEVAKIKINQNIFKKVYLVNLNEDIINTIPIKDGMVEISFKPKEIITLLFDLKEIKNGEV